MKVTVKDIGPIQKHLSVEIPAEVVSKELDLAYRELKQNVKVRGFRKGKAPRPILEQRYSKQVENDTLKKIIKDSLPDALKEANLSLILEPQLDLVSPLKPGTAFSYSAVLDLWPEFEIPKYKGLELERPSVEITEDEVQEQLKALQRHFATLESVEEDRPVKKGDLVVIDYSGETDGDSGDGIAEKDYYIEVGAGYSHPKFEEEILGMTKGSEKSFDISYPEDVINAKVAGKTVRYKVILKDIKKRILSDLDDNFAQKVGVGFDSIEKLKDRVYKQIKEDKEKAVESSLRQQLLEHLREQVDFPVPERLVEAKLTQIVDNVASHLQEKGMDFEKAGISEDRLRLKMREDAITQVKTEMILDKIAEAEKLTVDHQEISKYSEYAKSQSQRLGVDKEQLEASVIQNVLPKLRAKRTMDFLMKQAVIKPASQKEVA
ncbi:MAG: trigger factor [Nitrospiraceae bacterium]|nr:trigger factor [Nitrospiraceae bacterium]